MTRTRRTWPRFIAALALLAVLARALVPAGVMPAADGDRVLEICTSSGLALVVLPAQDAPTEDGKNGHAPPCPFAPHFTQTLPGGMPVLPAPVFAFVFLFLPAPPRRARAAAKHWRGQGPPRARR